MYKKIYVQFLHFFLLVIQEAVDNHWRFVHIRQQKKNLMNCYNLQDEVHVTHRSWCVVSQVTRIYCLNSKAYTSHAIDIHVDSLECKKKIDQVCVIYVLMALVVQYVLFN